MSQRINRQPPSLAALNPELQRTRFTPQWRTIYVPQRRAPRYAERGRKLATDMLQQPLQQGIRLGNLARAKLRVEGTAQVSQSFAITGLMVGSLLSPAAFVYGVVAGSQGATRLQRGQEAAGACIGNSAAAGARLGALMLRALRVLLATAKLALVPVRLGLMPVAMLLTALLLLLEQGMRTAFGKVGGALGHVVDFFGPPRFVEEKILEYSSDSDLPELDSDSDAASAAPSGAADVEFVSTMSRWST